jgi:diguanylate cyclase (GGDEF)-like protein/PAS domain S-box-containing protein
VHVKEMIGPGEGAQRTDAPGYESHDTGKYRKRARRESLLIGLAGLVAVGAGVLGLWIFATNSIRENYRHYLVTVAHAAALQLDPELHGKIRDPAQRNGAEYDRVVAPLRRMRKASDDIHYIYTAVLDGDQIRFVLDAADTGDHDGDGIDDQAGVWEVYEDHDPVMMEALLGKVRGDAASTEEPYEDKWGSFMTGYAPILGADGRQIGVVGVDVNASVYLGRIAAARRWALLGLLPSLLLVSAFALIYYRQRVRALDAARRLAFEQERLSESESSFRSLFELSPVGIALNDLASGRFLQVNDALVRSSGYSQEELLQKTYWDITPKDYSAAEDKQLDSMERTKHYGPYEKEYLRRDGSRYPVLLSGISLTDAHGRKVVWSIVQDISQRKAVERELADAARHDKLTGLANRTQFMERLQQFVQARKNGDPQLFAVLFLDFDHFKMVNDTLGHDAGDTLLREIAQRLHASLRDGAGSEGKRTLIARFGGDEFLVLVGDLSDSAAAESIAGRLLDTLAQSYSILGRDVHSTASIGIVTSEQCLESADAIVRNADVAMYEAKRAGRACHVVFNESMHVRLTRHVTIESDLRKALGTSQLTLVFQPIVELESGRTVSVEALLRWQHPELGDISPSEFVPIAEESGLIVALGQWVLLESCRMLADWRIRDPAGAPACVSVNISRTELALGQRLLGRLRETLASTGLPASCLQLEVTEREVMRDPDASLSLMHELRGLGVSLAMDDFGTGTSSLGCLRDYPFDVIKIDRSFVHDIAANPDVLALIHATVTLAVNLGKSSVAEGVETAAQVAVLQSLGCRYAQGYYFSRPLSAEQLVTCAETPWVVAATA